MIVPDQAAHHHTVSIYAWGFISDPALGWLQNEEYNYYYYRVA
jgi:hypothetical protein